MQKRYQLRLAGSVRPEVSQALDEGKIGLSNLAKTLDGDLNDAFLQSALGLEKIARGETAVGIDRAGKYVDINLPARNTAGLLRRHFAGSDFKLKAIHPGTDIESFPNTVAEFEPR